jgi:acid phosphatase (class A)
MKRILASIIVPILFAVAASGAQTHFLELSDVNVIELLPPPPVAASAEATADLDDVLKAQATRSDADIARGKSESKLSPAAFVTVLGTEFTAENFPHVYALLEDAAKDSKVFTTEAKAHFARPRPKLADDRVQPVVHGDDEPSYPSGHAARGLMWARILCEIAPEKKDALLERGQEIGWDRVLIGVHFPSDVYAGEVLGQAFAQAMLKNAEFQTRLSEAKEEYHSSSAAHPMAASLQLVH